MSEDSRNPQASQERLRQQQYMRQQFVRQQQEERRRNSEQQQQQLQQQAEQQWDGRNSIHDSPVRQNSSGSMTLDKSQQLHSAPIRQEASPLCNHPFQQLSHLLHAAQCDATKALAAAVLS